MVTPIAFGATQLTPVLGFYIFPSPGIIFLGILACTFDIKLLLDKKIHLTKGVVLALISMVGYGIYYAFILSRNTS